MREMGGTAMAPKNGSWRGTSDSSEYHCCDAQEPGDMECGGSIHRAEKEKRRWQTRPFRDQDNDEGP